MVGIVGIEPAEGHPGRQGKEGPRPDVFQGLEAVLGQGVQQKQGQKAHEPRHGEPQRHPQLRQKFRQVEMHHRVPQGPLPEGHQGQGQGDGDDQRHRVDQHLDPLGDGPPGRPQVVGRPHGPHQGVDGPHGEVDGKHQTEHHQLGAGVVADVGEVHFRQLHHLLRQKIRQKGHDPGDVQVQQAQQGADENEKREDHKQQVKGQSRALDGHVVLVVAVDHQHAEAQKPVFRQGIAPHSSVSL